MTEGYFRPGFSFEVPVRGVDISPWDLTGAIQAADRQASGTSVQSKIDRRLQKMAETSQASLTGKKRKQEEEVTEPDDQNDAIAGGRDSDSDIGSEDAIHVRSHPDALDSSSSSSDDDDDTNPGPSDLTHQDTSEKDSSDKMRSKSSNQSGTTEDPTPNRSGFFQKPPTSTSFKVKTFTDLHLSRPLIRACEALGYEKPTPIQASCIPLALAGRDICGSAITGSGKTAAFSLPLLERLMHRPQKILATYVLILTPTRELAVQVHSMIQNLAQFANIRVALVVGGLSLKLQSANLRSRPEIVVATPGRMIDHLRNSQSVDMEDLQALVFDEADKLLQMGFKDEIEEIIRLTPRQRQTMLFSATMTAEVRSLMALSLRNPVRLAADASGKVPKNLVQEVVRVKGTAPSKKEAIVLALCSRTFKEKVIVFCKTKQQAHRLKLLFGLLKLPPAGELHGNMAQADRLMALESFRKGENAFLLATDVAGRGLDILGVQVVINLDAPRDLDTYLHRIGRTARAGAQGRSVTLITSEDRKLIKEVMKKTGSKLANRSIPTKVVETFSQQIAELKPDLDVIFSQEQEERILRKAEIDMGRAENIVEHENEILSRPKRTWFQDWKGKRESARKGKAQAEGTLLEEDTNQTARGKQREKGLSQKKTAPQIEETKHLMGGVKAMKRSIQELQSKGVNSWAAELLAAAECGPKKKRKKKGTADKKTSDLFTGEGTEIDLTKRTKVYPGGGQSGQLRKETGRNPRELARLKRGGKGRHAFKGKKRYKRN